MERGHAFNVAPKLSKLFECAVIMTLILGPGAITSLDFPNKLKHVYVIFAHKLYAPLTPDTQYGFPEKLEYEYFLADAADMPNKAKLEIVELGIHLRRRYDDFLGDIYYSEVSRTYTSEYFLSMISGQLVNAGLWPPAKSQQWNEDLNWQPIPSAYQPKETDRLFLGTMCPHFLDEEKRVLDTDESIKNEVSEHQGLFDYVSSHYGKKIERPADVSLLYSSLETMASYEELNKTLPGWAEGIFPEGEMRNVTLLSYTLLSKTRNQRQLNGGVFLKKIINEATKLITTNATFDVNSNTSRDAKISLWSAEDRNLIGVLQAMNLWWSPHLLDNGASIILELRHNESAKEYGFEIYYYTGINMNETMGLTLPGCKAFCPLSDFARILSEVLPTDENLLCHTEHPIVTDSNSSADSNQARAYLR
ncbi:venom acid phosphatase Acph-1-like isoform X2 [Venturia canescens]|nr:venom acid phosphatase Acph-1-like isoform X2 [Venturia canescens]